MIKRSHNIGFFFKIDVNEVTQKTDVEFSLCSSVTSVFGEKKRAYVYTSMQTKGL